jgi:hypothetical protein
LLKREDRRGYKRREERGAARGRCLVRERRTSHPFPAPITSGALVIDDARADRS